MRSKPARVGDEDPGAGVLQAVEDLVGLPPAVEPDEDAAEVDRRPEGQAPLGVVGRQHRDPVAVAEAEAIAQRRRRALARSEELGEPRRAGRRRR